MLNVSHHIDIMMRLGKLNQRLDTVQQGEHRRQAKDGIDVKNDMEVIVCSTNAWTIIVLDS